MQSCHVQLARRGAGLQRQCCRRARGRICDLVGRLRIDHLHHQFDDVARGAELPVDAGAGDLGEQIFVQVAGGIAIFHRDAVEHVHHTGQQLRGWDCEAGVLHVLAVGRAVPAKGPEKREHLLRDDLEHLAWLVVLKHRPPQVLLVGSEAQADEQQIGDLLDHLEWIGDASGPEGIPNSVDLALQLPSDQMSAPRRVPAARPNPNRTVYSGSETLREVSCAVLG